VKWTDIILCIYWQVEISVIYEYREKKTYSVVTFLMDGERRGETLYWSSPHSHTQPDVPFPSLSLSLECHSIIF
jgi:hypothetical protein